MDPNGNIIPIVEDDQGEGYMDEVPPEILDKLTQMEPMSKESLQEAFDKLVDDLKAGDDLEPTEDFETIAEEIITPEAIKPQKIQPPKRMMMRKGMPIEFYGCKYKVIATRKNGRVVLQFKGFTE